jgi:Glycosyltransferase family 87
MTRPRRTLITLAAVVLGCLAAAPWHASAQVVTVTVPKSLDRAPAGFSLTPRQALRVAQRRPEVARERRQHPGLRPQLVIPHYFGDRRYEVAYRAGGKVLVDVHVAARSGRVIELWTGPQADTLLARGYDPPIGRSLNKLYVWLPLALLFMAPFFDPRRPLRVLHLDLLVLLGFGVSQIFFNRGDVQLSVPLVYPLLAYLLARMLHLGLRRSRAPSGPLLPHAAPRLLLIGLVLLVAFRVGLNAVDSHTIDVGQASVFGADRIQNGEDLYQRGNKEDTYGPVMYLAYVPFEALFPDDGPGGYEHAARAAAISFDLLTMAGLMLLGTRLRRGRDGRVLGLTMAYAWAAYPFTLCALQANTNDALVAALLVGVLLAMRSPPLRGLLMGVATAAKFAPLALAPLVGRGLGGRRPRDLALFAAAFVGSVALAVFAYLPDGGLSEFWNTTVGYQLGRASPFSLWGLHPSLGWAQDLVKASAALLAAAVFLVPRERDLRRIAALGAAVVIAVELTATYWFYFYILWFTPLVLPAIFAAYDLAPGRRPDPGGVPEWLNGAVSKTVGRRKAARGFESHPLR